MNPEVRKQLIDQPLHFVWSVAAALLPVLGHKFFGLTGLLVGGLLCAGNIAGQVLREVKQWPSKRWWDPPMDWVFLVLGYVAVWLPAVLF